MEQHKRKILFFISPSCGGAERMTVTIAKLLDRDKFDVHFAVVGRSVGEVMSLIPEGYPVHFVHIRNIYDFTTFRMKRLMKNLHPDVVFCSLVYLNPRVINAAASIGGIKIIARCNCAVYRITGITKKLTAKSFPKADLVIAQTEQMQKELVTTFGMSDSKVVAMHNMIDGETIAQKLKDADNPYPTDGKKHFVWVGRYVDVKGADVLVKAFAEARKIDNNIDLYMVGKCNESEPYYQSVKALIDEYQLSDSIHLVGFQQNPYIWMKYVDCFVLSSRSEASPNALFESLYLGVPSVATRCTPNIDDIIAEGINGYTVPVEDHENLGKKMLEALSIENACLIYKTSSPDDFRRLFE